MRKLRIGKIKIPSLPVLFSKHGKNDTSKMQLVLLLRLISWKAGVRFLSQSQSVAIVIAQLLLTVIWKPRSKWVACTMWIAKCEKCGAVWKLSKRGIKCLTFNDLVTVIFLKIAVCLMLLLNTKSWFIIGGWLLSSYTINWTSIRFILISTIFYSGLSPHLYQVVALSNRVLWMWWEFCWQFRQPPLNIAVRYVDRHWCTAPTTLTLITTQPFHTLRQKNVFHGKVHVDSGVHRWLDQEQKHFVHTG